MMLCHVKNVVSVNFIMSQSLGYRIIAFNTLGEVTLSNLQIKGTNY